jgi:predicted nucleic acid-binding protein
MREVATTKMSSTEVLRLGSCKPGAMGDWRSWSPATSSRSTSGLARNWRCGSLDLVSVSAILVAAPPLPEPASGDPDDDKFLACALAAGVGYVVSGDRDLLDASPYGAVRVLKPRAFIDRVLFNRS